MDVIKLIYMNSKLCLKNNLYIQYLELLFSSTVK